MPKETEGYVSRGIIGILEKLKEARNRSLSEEKAMEKMVGIAIEAAISSTQKAAELSGRFDLIEQIEEKGKILRQNILAGEIKGTSLLGRLSSAARNMVRDAIHFSTQLVGIEKAVHIFSKDVTGFFRSQRKKSPTIAVLADLGRLIGQAFPLPMASLAGELVGAFIATLADFINNNVELSYSHKRLIMETEFSQKNLEMLYEFGVKEQRMTILTQKFLEECSRLDKKFGENAVESQKLKKKMFRVIEDL